MKKILGAILTVMLALSLLSVPAFAADQTYRLDELGMRITPPPNTLVFTRDMRADDPGLAALGWTRDGLLASMMEKNVYLIAVDQTYNYEINVGMIESAFADFNAYDDKELLTLMDAFKTAYSDAGITVQSMEIDQCGQAKFVKMFLSHSIGGETGYSLQYYTAYNSQAISITLYSYNGSIPAYKENLAERMVFSAVFDTEPQRVKTPETPVQTEAFTYTDEESGMTFTVPANWVETPMNEQREFLDVKFISTLDETQGILFSSLDLFTDSFMEEAGLTEAEKRQLTRAMLDQSILTDAFAADAWGVPESEIRRVMIGEKEYFYAETMAEGTALGMTISLPMTCVMRVENGYMYLFQFGDSSRSPYFQDFEALVSSAQYPQVEVQSGQSSSVHQLLRQGPAVYVPVLLISFALTLVGYSAFPLIFAGVRRKTITKKKYNLICYGVNFLVMIAFIVINDSASSGSPYILWTWIFSAIGTRILKKRGVLDGYQPDMPTEPEYDPPGEETAQPEATHSIRFCRQCGNELAEGSRFCNKCGTPVIPE